MLTIRREQLAALGADRRQAWEDRMVQAVAHDHPPRFHALGEPKVRELVRLAISRGAELGIETPTGVGSLLELMLAFGPDFERSPDRAWAQAMLAHPEAPPELRIHLVRDRMMATTSGRHMVPFQPPATPGKP